MASKTWAGPSSLVPSHFLISQPAPFVAHVEINRPEKLNAFHAAMWAELSAVFRALSRDEDVRVVVLSGRGDRAFSAGLDVVAAAGGGGSGGVLGVGGGEGDDVDVARRAHRLRRHIDDFQTCVGEVERCEKREFFLVVLAGTVAYTCGMWEKGDGVNNNNNNYDYSRHRPPPRHIVRARG